MSFFFLSTVMHRQKAFVHLADAHAFEQECPALMLVVVKNAVTTREVYSCDTDTDSDETDEDL